MLNRWSSVAKIHSAVFCNNCFFVINLSKHKLDFLCRYFTLDLFESYDKKIASEIQQIWYCYWFYWSKYKKCHLRRNRRSSMNTSYFRCVFSSFLVFFLYSPLTFYESDDIYVACKENILFIFNGTEFSYKYRKIKSLKVVATKCTRIWKKSYIFYYFEWFWTYSLLVRVNSKNFWWKSFVVSSETYVDLSNLFI